jgi:hypothetical protein
MIKNLYVVCDAPSLAHVCRLLYDGPRTGLTPRQAGMLAARAANAHCSDHKDCRAQQLCVSEYLDGIESGEYMIKFKLQYTKELLERDRLGNK